MRLGDNKPARGRFWCQKVWISRCLQLASGNFRVCWVLGAPKTSCALKNQTDINKVNVLIIPELHHQGHFFGGADLCHLVNLLAKFHHFSQLMLPSELPHNLSKDNWSLFEGCKRGRRCNYIQLHTKSSSCNNKILNHVLQETVAAILWRLPTVILPSERQLLQLSPDKSLSNWTRVKVPQQNYWLHMLPPFPQNWLWSWVTMKCVPKANIMIATKALLWTS